MLLVVVLLLLKLHLLLRELPLQLLDEPLLGFDFHLFAVQLVLLLLSLLAVGGQVLHFRGDLGEHPLLIFFGRGAQLLELFGLLDDLVFLLEEFFVDLALLSLLLKETYRLQRSLAFHVSDIGLLTLDDQCTSLVKVLVSDL